MSQPSGTTKTVLVVEDEYFIAEVLTEAFAMQNWSVVGPFPDIKSALGALDGGQVADVAVLDVNLKGELVYPLVDRLIQGETAVILTTGYDLEVIPKPYAHLPRFIKPVSINAVLGCADKAILGH